MIKAVWIFYNQGITATRIKSRCNRGRPNHCLVAILLLLSPLPLEQNPDEVLEVEVRPQSINEEDLCILMALPKHEVAKALDSAGSYKDI
jgi:hypothetical protein